MKSQNKIPFLCASLLALGASSSSLLAQEPLRAEVVEDLQNDRGTDFFMRGKNVYDSAAKSNDLETRRMLYFKASEIFSDYLNEFQKHKNAEAAWYYLGSCYYQSGMKEDAKRCFSTLLNRYRGGKWASAAAYTLGADHYNQREYAMAAPLFERYANSAAQESDKPRGYLLAANCYRLLGRDREAISAYKKVIADPAGVLFRDQALLQVGKITYKGGQLKEALEMFEDVVKNSNSAETRGDAALQAAITATKLDQTELAEKYLRYILSNPGTEKYRPDAQIALMENYFQRKQYKEVLDFYKQSSAKAEGETEAKRLMVAARAMVQLKMPAEASTLFREIERLVKPENDLAYRAAYYRLNCFFQIEGKHVVEQIDAFLQIYAKSRPRDTRIHTAMLMKAETIFAEGKAADAAKVYAKIDPTLLSDSNLPGFLYQRGWCLSDAGDPQGAIRSFTDFITKYPQDPRFYPALVKRAKAFAEIGEAGKAIADFDRLATDKKAPEDLASLAWLESARTRRDEGNNENMVIRYKGLLEKVSDLDEKLKAEANYFIGFGLVKTNKPKEATPFLDTSRNLRPGAYGKHAGILLSLSTFAAQDFKGLSREIDLGISGDYVEDIPDQAIQWAGMQAYGAGDHGQAARFLKLVTNSDEPRATPKEVWRYLAKSLIDAGEPSEALPAISNVLEVEKNASWKADAMLDRARALLALGRYGEARKSADEALELRPQGRTSAHLLVVSGDLFVQEENLGRAGADYLKVIEFHEDEDLKPLAIHKYIQVLEKQGNSAESGKYKAKLESDFPDWVAP